MSDNIALNMVEYNHLGTELLKALQSIQFERELNRLLLYKASYNVEKYLKDKLVVKIDIHCSNSNIVMLIDILS